MEPDNHGTWMFPRNIGEFEIGALVQHIMKKTGAEVKYSVVSTSTIKTGPKGVQQETKICGPLRVTITFTNQDLTSELIDIEGISASTGEYEGFRSSYSACDLEGMRESLSTALQKAGDAIRSYFS